MKNLSNRQSPPVCFAFDLVCCCCFLIKDLGTRPDPGGILNIVRRAESMTQLTRQTDGCRRTKATTATGGPQDKRSNRLKPLEATHFPPFSNPAFHCCTTRRKQLISLPGKKGNVLAIDRCVRDGPVVWNLQKRRIEEVNLYRRIVKLCLLLDSFHLRNTPEITFTLPK